MAPPSISCAKQLQTRAYERIRAHTWTVLSAWRRLKPELTSAGVLPAVAASSRGDDSSCPCIFLHKQRPSAGQPVRGPAWVPRIVPSAHSGAARSRGTGARRIAEHPHVLEPLCKGSYRYTDLRRRPSSAMPAPKCTGRWSRKGGPWLARLHSLNVVFALDSNSFGKRKNVLRRV